MVKPKIKEITALTVVLFIVFSVYISTMHPVYKNNDSPETTAAAATLGIGHAPGYPLYTMAGKIAVLVPLANPAFRMNIFSSFLALLALLATYYILVNIIPGNFGQKRVYAAACLFILAFSGIFWNQAIEAKGGIYILNLLFLALLILLSLKLFERFRPVYLYLMAYVFGLSLSNHWPSMIILLPVFGWVFVKYRRKFTVEKAAVSGVLFLLGLTPYLYLFLRAKTGPVLNWGDPSTAGNFLWVVLRKGYSGEIAPATAYVFKYQIKEFLGLMAWNFSFLWIFAPFGGVYLYKKKRNIFWMLAAVFFITVVIVVFYNRTKEEVIWLISIFLIPAVFGLYIFIVCGIFEEAGKKRGKVMAGFAAALALVMAVISFKKNNASQDYILYDFGNNVAATIEKNSSYLPLGDFNVMPFVYKQAVKRQRMDILFTPISFLKFGWGVNQVPRYGREIEWKEGEIETNTLNTINKLLEHGPIYRNFTSPLLDSLGFKGVQKGILKRVPKAGIKYPNKIYRLYSYRGIYSPYAHNRVNIEIVTRYFIFMALDAHEKLKKSLYEESFMLYEKALAFPVEKLEYNIYYNMAEACLGIDDEKKAKKYLVASIRDKGDFVPSLEKLGYLYYRDRDFIRAREMLGRAAAAGSKNEQVIRALNALR